MVNIDEIKKQVSCLLEKDDSGHAMDHINRVYELSLKFAQNENVNLDVIKLIALLHDVDDYKLFGKSNAENLTNAKMIMENANVSEEIENQVLNSLRNIGYSKLLRGYRSTTIEGMIVSDADMCDALGVTGILRVYKYSIKNGKPFFDKTIFPIENMTADKYTRKCADTSVCHIFEKILKLKNLMLTESGKKEAEKRHDMVVNVLYNLFEEENVPEWKEYLDNFLDNNYPEKTKKK